MSKVTAIGAPPAGWSAPVHGEPGDSTFGLISEPFFLEHLLVHAGDIMARPASVQPTEVELQILNILWDLGPSPSLRDPQAACGI